jgi:DNA-binding NtrC family response regulator
VPDAMELPRVRICTESPGPEYYILQLSQIPFGKKISIFKPRALQLTMSNRKKVLIIDDEVDLCLLLKSYLNRRNYEVYYSHTLKEGMTQFQQVLPDILFLDNNLPDGTGWEKAALLLEKYPELQVHLISAYQPHTPEKIASSFKVWEKPLTLKELDHYIK